jgi:hypothetical protein
MERLVLPLLWSSALVFAVIGVFFLALPERAAGSIGVILSDATARTDVRATYGGMMLGTALFFVWAALAPDRHTAGLWLMLLMYGGLALGRVVAIAGGERPGQMMWIFLVIELVVAVLSGLALHKG